MKIDEKTKAVALLTDTLRGGREEVEEGTKERKGGVRNLLDDRLNR
jgi:hypothetical protein